jgi:hypothetical protein
VLANPVDARAGLQAVINQVAQEQADIVRFGDGLQGSPVGVDIGQQQDFHGPLRPVWRNGLTEKKLLRIIN